MTAKYRLLMPQDTNDEAKYYAVSVGRKCGIYDDWETAKRQVNGYSGNRYKGYNTGRGAINYMKKEGFKEPQVFLSRTTSNSKHTTFSSSGITTTTSTGASSNPMATKEVGTGPGAPINNQSDTPVMKSVGTGEEGLRQNNHTSMSDWAQISMQENSTIKCVSCVNMLEIVKVMSAQLTALQSEVSTLTKRIEKLSEKPTSTHMNLSYSDAATRGRSPPAPPLLPTTQQYQQHKPPPQHQQQQQPQQSQQHQAPPPNQTNQTQQQRQQQPQPQPPAPVRRPPRPTDPVFDPSKCVIIHSEHKDFSQVNHDNVRAAIAATVKKPILIDIINRYKSKSEDPKYLVQLADPSLIDSILTNWKSTNLGGSTVRRPIKPNNNTAVLKGVPTDLSETELLTEIGKSYENIASIYRLKSKDNKPLHTVKITFETKHQLEHAIKNGIALQSLNLIVRVERLIKNDG